MLKRMRIGRWLAYACLLFLGSSLFFTLIYAILPVPVTPLMIQRKIESWQPGNKAIDLQYQWASSDEISDKMVLAVIASEDQFFLDHAGFDLLAIQKAFSHNQKGKKLRGGSTISQQVAKNVFLWPSRSWIRKGLEAWFTVLIELIWGKKRIMEVYLNVVELGPGIFGVKAAAQNYFHKSAQKLNSVEAASLAAVLPSPLRYSVKNPSGYVFRRRGRIQLRMYLLDGTRVKSDLWNSKNRKKQS